MQHFTDNDTDADADICMRDGGKPSDEKGLRRWGDVVRTWANKDETNKNP